MVLSMKKNFRLSFVIFVALVLICFVSCQNPFFQKLSGLYDVSFSTSGGSEVTSIHTRLISECPVSTKTDCDFEGWYLTSDFSGEKIIFPFEVTSNMTLYAKWNQKYRVNFQTFDGSAVESQLVSSLVEVETPYKTNCDFVGWYTNSNFTGDPIVFPYEVTKPITLYAKYLQRYTLKFETNGGNEIDDMTIGLIQVLPEPTRTNYDFDGWYLYPNFSGTSLQLPYTITHNTTLYAKWLPTYLVSFETNGGNAINSYRARKITSLQTPTKAGFTFLEWYLDNEFSELAEFPIELEEDTIFYAKWQQNHTVIFDSQGGSSVASITTGRIETEPQPTKANKSFAGWYTDSGCAEENKVSFPYTVSTDVTLYAKWIAEQCRITYYANGATSGTVPQSVTVDKGSSYTVSGNTGNLEKTGYAFTKWNTRSDGEGQGYSPGSTITVTGEVSLYAQWGKDYAALVTVEGGSFYFGDPNSSSERPKITLSSFQIAQYELTYELWLEVYTWATSEENTLGYSLTAANKGYATNDQYKSFVPATNISWNMACVWLNAYSEYKGLEPVYYRGSTVWRVDTNTIGTFSWDKTKNGYRLPTECEWEFAAGGGSAETHDNYKYAGSNTIGDVAWYSGNSGNETHPVGTKKSNALGIYDMSGNVAEWCYDYYADFGTGELTNPVHESGSYKVIRGGDCIANPNGSVQDTRPSCSVYERSSNYAEEKVKYYEKWSGNYLYYCRGITLGIRPARNAE